MKNLLRSLLLLSALLSFSVGAVVIETEDSPGVYSRAKSTSGVLQTIINSGTVSTSSVDPCQSSAVAKSSAIINISTATTTALVAVSGSTVVYVCGFSLTISQVITTANTLKFIQGTGATCSGAPADLTGLYGAGGVTAAAPIVVVGLGGTIFKTGAGGGLCAVTAIGASGSFQGVVTYVQQ